MDSADFHSARGRFARSRDEVAEWGSHAPRLNSNAARGKFAPSRTITKNILDKSDQGFCLNLPAVQWILLAQRLSFRASNFPRQWFADHRGRAAALLGKLSSRANPSGKPAFREYLLLCYQPLCLWEASFPLGLLFSMATKFCTRL